MELLLLQSCLFLIAISASSAHASSLPLPSPVASQLQWNSLNTTTLSRQLQQGEFDALNAILEGAVIDINGPFETDAGSGPFVTRTLHIDNVQCSNLRVGQIEVDVTSSEDISTGPPPEGLPLITNLALGIADLEYSCTADLLLDMALDDIRGTILLQSGGTPESQATDVGVNFALVSSKEEVPIIAQTTSCNAAVHIDNLDFDVDSGLLGSILDLVDDFIEPLIRGPVAEALADTVCEEMESIGSVALPEILNQLSEAFEPYLQPVVINPLRPEQELARARLANATPGVKSPYINFQNADSDHDASDLTHFVLDGLDEFDAWLGSKVTNATTNSNDLAINSLLRKMLLDDTGAFVWDMNEPFVKALGSSPLINSKQATASTKPAESTGEGMVLLESHDDLLQMVLTLDRVSIRGLDSMTHFDTLQRIGNHTLQNKLGWKFLSGTADLSMRITPSSLDSSLWAETRDGLQMVENVQLELKADDVQAVLSLFAAIHQDRLGHVPLGALFQSDAISTCLMSTLHPAQLVSGLSAEVSNLGDPTIEGFTSPGLDRVLIEVMDLMYNLYEHWLIESLPNFAQTTLRESVNEMWMQTMKDLTTEEACPVMDLPVDDGKVAYVDFRDLLLPPGKAQATGGSGQEPYGDVVVTLFMILNEQLLAVDEGDPNKRLILNSLILDPLTEAQSGQAGTVRFSTPLIKFEVNNKGKRNGSSTVEEIAASLFDSMELQVYNTTVRNINTIVEPTYILETTPDNPFMLKNLLQMGPIRGQPLMASVLIRLAVDPFDEGERRLMDSSSDLVEHIMELSFSASSLEIMADVMAIVNARKLLDFHLQDVFNPYCWLATVEQSEKALGLKLESLLTDLPKLAMDIECMNKECSDAGLGVLSDLSKIWQNTNVTTTIGERFEALATELLTGDFAHNQVARWVDEAPIKCPHNEDYNSVPKAYLPLEPPIFSPLSMDTIVFTALTAAQAGMLLMSEIHPSMLGITTDGGPKAETKSSDDYIDFTSTNGLGNLTDIVSYLFSQASELFGQKGKELGINSIVKGMLNDAGLLELRFNGATIVEDPSLQLRLDKIWVGGLDTFTQFDVLKAVGPQMLQNNIQLERLSAEIDLSVVSGGNSQRVIITFGAEDIAASLPVYAAINATELDGLELGSLLVIDNILSCIFTAVEEMHLPSFDLKIGNVTDVAVRGLLPASGDAFAKSMSTVQKMFGISIDGMVSTVLRGVLNGIVSSWKNNAVCANTMLASSRRRAQESSAYIDFRDLFLSPQESFQYGGSGESPYGDLFRTVLGFVDDLILDVDPETQLAAVNEMLIAPLTKALSSVSGTIIMPGNIVDVGNRVSVGGFDATFTFRASQVMVDNLDTLRDPIALLAPVKGEAHQLNNTARMGLPDVRPLSASVRILLGLEDGDDIDLRNDLRLTMDMQEVSMVLTALLKVMEDQFATFPLGDILNPDCWLAKMPTSRLDEYGFSEPGAEPSASVSELMASVSRLSLKTKCFSCTSEGLEDWNTEGSKDIEAATDRIVNYATSVLGGKFLQVQIDRALNNAAKRCPHSPEYDPNFSAPNYSTFESEHESSTTFLLMILIVTAAVVVVLALIAVCMRCFVRVRHQKLLKSLPDRQLYLLQKDQEKEDKRGRELNAVTRSLFLSSASIPAFVRYFIPVVILGNIGLFLSGHLSLGATVNIEISLGGQSFLIEEFFSFSMAKSTVDIWNAGGKALAALIFIFSGLWPYTKQIITLVLWFTPPARVSMARRGSILVWLDQLSKWSMIDIFVLLVSIAGFRVSIVSPDLDFLPEDFYSIDLLVVPVWGLYANLIAQLVSQISSHFILHYHRKVADHAHRARHAMFRKTAGFLPHDEDHDAAEGFLDEHRGSSSTSSESENTEESFRKDKLCEHVFVRPHSSNSKLAVRGCMNPLLVFVALAMSALLLAGCILPSFSLEVMGIIGVFVESGSDWKQAVEHHSVFTITELLMDQARFVGGAGNYIGLGTLSAVLILTVLIVPLVLAVALLCHWFAPMNKRTRRRMEVFLETLHAWQYVEVYLIAMVVASWQLGPISQFMINAYCGDLDQTFDMLVYYGILSPGDAQCFQVEASIESAAYMLAASAILLSFLNAYVANASRQYFRDIEKKSKKETLPADDRSVANASTTNPADNISAVTGPGQSTVQPLAVANVDESSSLGSDKGEEHVLAIMEYQGDNFNDEEQEKEAFVDPLATAVVTEEPEHNWQRSEAMEKIHPVPVLFTDKFRWTLQSQEDNRDANPTTIKGDPYISVDMDPTSDSHSLSKESQSSTGGETQPFLMSGDAPSSMPPTPAQSTLDGDSTRDESSVAESEEEFSEEPEKFVDEVDITDEVVRVLSLGGDWESESEDGNNDDIFSRGETVDMSVSTAQVESVAGMDQSSNSRSEEDSVLLGNGSVLLEPARRTEESFADELESDDNASWVTDESSIFESTRVLHNELREAEDDWRRNSASDAEVLSGTNSGSTRPLSNATTTRPRGNSQLQAAFLEDVEL